MNEERLLKIIEDMAESIKNLEGCVKVLESRSKDDTTPFIEFGLKQIFVDFFITVENLTSLILKEIKEFKIGIDMKESLSIMNINSVVNDEVYAFLSQARLLRNRISHRYKEPTSKELLEFINDNKSNFIKVLDMAKNLIK
jgi:uncharacterized protein YutE (UPF0331/DUF86 family)